MGYDTYFHGMLEFTRPLTERELRLLDDVRDSMGRCDLNVSDDRRGLVYRSEKTYDMVDQVNRLIEVTRKLIPDFGLKGTLAADTDFEPHLWFLKIAADGTAYAENATRDQFLAFRRKIYPNGYKGFGLMDEPSP
jgi:hypothetical protein